MNSIEEAKEKLHSLISKSSFEKMVYVTAILTKLLEHNRIRPIIVGGLAVEIYTRSDYTTVDIDVIVSDRKLAGDILVQLGFIPEGRHWYHEELMVSIEIPNDVLEDADHDRIIELKMSDGLKVFVIGIEDIILDRLRACIHWKSTSDCEWGKRMFYLHFERIDLEYMRKEAKSDLTIERLEKWIREYK
jgi:predicted nucleotidyltransferase